MIDDQGLFWVDRSDRERRALRGPDRAKFLHNLCTNDIKALGAGHGREAFVTSPQGKTIGFLTIHATENELLVRADRDGFVLAGPHFDKYGVFDDVAWDDQQPTAIEFHLAGAAADAWLRHRELGLPSGRELDLAQADWEGSPVTLIRESPLGIAGLTLIGPIVIRDSVVKSLENARQLSSEEAEGLRIAAGTPRFGVDVTAENLPQEIGRDSRAISFTKGCYLGQETVARLDALGHVNKLLKRLRVVEGGLPAPGTALTADGTAAGVVTSSGFSPGDGGVALVMVRVKAAGNGSTVAWDGGQGTLADMPV